MRCCDLPSPAAISSCQFFYFVAPLRFLRSRTISSTAAVLRERKSGRATSATVNSSSAVTNVISAYLVIRSFNLEFTTLLGRQTHFLPSLRRLFEVFSRLSSSFRGNRSVFNLPRLLSGRPRSVVTSPGSEATPGRFPGFARISDSFCSSDSQPSLLFPATAESLAFAPVRFVWDYF